ncbi:MAG TPA: hypothetical protein VGT82_06400, partial [Ktedonobacteraceae bacterium]|nr:hypothetical protein [Ktedonobacteraceae bacterium]
LAIIGSGKMEVTMLCQRSFELHWVGTAFMPSGDSSPYTASTRMWPGFTLVQGDESPDAIKSGPYPLAGFIEA